MSDPEAIDATDGPGVLVLEGPVGPDAVPDLCARLRALLAAQPTRAVVLDVAGLTDVDVASVEAVARLQLTAKQAGAAVELRHAGERLRGLLRLVGLHDVVPCEGRSSSVVEAGRQPQVGEEGVDAEEVVQPDDPPL